MEKLVGECLCGKVKFEVENDFDYFHLCHCKQCQRATGSAHASNLFTRIDNINWLSGGDSIKRFDVPGRTISNAFCLECGSGLPYLSLSGNALVIPAGCLNESPNISPQMNIFWSERAPWYDAAVLAKHVEKFPE